MGIYTHIQIHRGKSKALVNKLCANPPMRGYPNPNLPKGHSPYVLSKIHSLGFPTWFPSKYILGENCTSNLRESPIFVTCTISNTRNLCSHGKGTTFLGTMKANLTTSLGWFIRVM